ncbi:hypothetical protein PYCC9005_000482 [Savitreella phatthalungensis]
MPILRAADKIPAQQVEGDVSGAGRPEYGAAAPADGRVPRYYSQQVNGQPHVPRIRLEPLKATRSGLVTSVPLPYAIYGEGPTRILLLGGLALSAGIWDWQIEYFARRATEYSVMTLDLRGPEAFKPHVPLQLPSTKQYAREVAEAIEGVGWTDALKTVHVVGFSFGALVGLQLARVAPDFVASLHIVSGCAKFRPPTLAAANVANGARLVKNNQDADKAGRVLDLMFPPDYLYAHDPDFPEWKNTRDRLLAKDAVPKLLAARQNHWNYYTQVFAAARHSLTPANLWEAAAKVRYVFVSAGARDVVLHGECATDLMKGLNAHGRIYPDAGHMLMVQEKDAFNRDQEAMMHRASREYQEYPPLRAGALNTRLATVDEDVDEDRVVAA